MAIYISPRIRAKLKEKHSVTEEEVHQCFWNHEGGYLKDTRDGNATDPPTWWFVSETNTGRMLKVVYVANRTGDKVRIDIKSAFPPELQDIELYERHGK